MLEIIEWLVRVAQVIPFIVMAASLVCALTPTPKDDQFLGKMYRILDWCALNVHKAKQVAPKK
tara:strand:- start:609 stop:797 length:189 start_codon:yes stop_codon:yes gene_type:complete